MEKYIKKYPIAFGIISCLVIYLLFILAHLPYGPYVMDISLLYLLDSILRIIFSIPVFILLGYIYNTNGIDFAFSTKGFAKGLFASLAIFLLIFTFSFKFFLMVEINKIYIQFIPFVILQQITTGLYEELSFRGLLMSGMLQKWSNTKLGRVCIVLVSGIIFGLIHLANYFNNANLQSTLWNALYAGMVGIGFSGVYIYSKNLLAAMFIHTIYNIPIHLSNGLIARISTEAYTKIILNAQSVLFFAIIPLFAILLSIKSEPFKYEKEP